MSADLLEVAADLALALEAQVALVFRLAHAADRAATDPREAAYARLLTPAVKFPVCKSTPQVVCESLECLGGNRYTEDLWTRSRASCARPRRPSTWRRWRRRWSAR